MIPCNACGASVEEILNLGSHPIVNHLTSSPDVRVELYPMKVGGCLSCGLIQLTTRISPVKFYTDYATPTAWKREPHIGSLLGRLRPLVDRAARVLDVGCNDGRFLGELVREGWTDVSGIEPTRNMSGVAQDRGFTVLQEELSLALAQEITEQSGNYQCVTVRQVLEHIHELPDFGRALNHLLSRNGILVIEVPDSRTNTLHADYALWEEHVNYFTPETLRAYLSAHGFAILDSYTSVFSGVCLTVIAQKVASPRHGDERVEVSVNELRVQVDNFRLWAREYAPFKNRVGEELSDLSASGPVILYGVGSRSSSFVNVMGVSSLISFAIDDQPQKQGLFMPFSGVGVRSPAQAREEIAGDEFFALLGVNGENEDKLMAESHLLNEESCMSVLPPSRRLLQSWRHPFRAERNFG